MYDYECVCLTEFLVFAQKQEENRKQWLAMENQIRDTQRALNEATKLTSKLELQVHHANGLLRDEIKGRIQAQQEKRKLVITTSWIAASVMV